MVDSSKGSALQCIFILFIIINANLFFFHIAEQLLRNSTHVVWRNSPSRLWETMKRGEWVCLHGVEHFPNSSIWHFVNSNVHTSSFKNLELYNNLYCCLTLAPYWFILLATVLCTVAVCRTLRKAWQGLKTEIRERSEAHAKLASQVCQMKC